MPAEPDDVDARDRPLLGALVAGTLRWHFRLDWQLRELLARPLGEEEFELAALLRVGLFQLQWLRIPEHAAVSATVDAAGYLGRRYAKPLVNAVLRRFVRERDALDERMAAVPEARFSHPRWLIDAIEADWPDAVQRILDANNALPPMWLRINTLRTSIGQYTNLLAEKEIRALTAEDLPQAILLETPMATADLPGFAEGLVSVQDAAAQYAAPLMRLEKGQRVLDACAAPGGKLAHMLEICPEIIEIHGVDIDAERIASTRANLTRLGLSAKLIAADVGRPESWWDGMPFDRILLDAPCTATGVIRRHPDIKLLRKASDVATAAATQSSLLESLWPLLKPGGRLVYSTCSVLKRENEERVRAFLADHSDAIETVSGDAFVGQNLPGEANRDGFYYACIDRDHGR